jgi:hypothetical protein
MQQVSTSSVERIKAKELTVPRSAPNWRKALRGKCLGLESYAVLNWRLYENGVIPGLVMLPLN